MDTRVRYQRNQCLSSEKHSRERSKENVQWKHNIETSGCASNCKNGAYDGKDE